MVSASAASTCAVRLENTSNSSGGMPLISAWPLTIGPQVMLAASDSWGLLLPWALETVVECTPDAIGLVGAADYSGPRSTPLLGNLSHRTRAHGYAAELVTAACLTYRGWPSGDVTLGEIRRTGGRLDFGVKLLGAGTARATAEADILVTTRDGRRHAVDVKYSHIGRFAMAPSAAMLDVVEQAIGRGEIDSFHFVTNEQFSTGFHRRLRGRRGVHSHDRVWPTVEDLARVRLQQLQRVSHATLLGGAADRHAARFEVRSRILEAYADVYRRAFGADRDLRWIDIDGHEHLFDSTVSNDPEAAMPRLVAIGGDSTSKVTPRDRSFMRHFPLTDGPVDRGHLLARQAGGAEGIGLNLVPQDSRLNRGQGRDGRRWRALERAAARTPGIMCLTRAIYDDSTDVPAWFEVVHISHDDSATVDRFPNHRGLP
jgi:hypothetical protein